MPAADSALAGRSRMSRGTVEAPAAAAGRRLRCRGGLEADQEPIGPEPYPRAVPKTDRTPRTQRSRVVVNEGSGLARVREPEPAVLGLDQAVLAREAPFGIGQNPVAILP